MPAERLQVLDLVGRPLQFDVSLPQPLREKRGQACDRSEPEQVETDGEHCQLHRRQNLPRRQGKSWRSGELGGHEPGVERTTEDADHDAAPARLHRGRGNDRQRIQRGEVAVDPPRQVHECRDDNRVERQLQIDQPPVLLGTAQQHHVRGGQRKGQTDEREERVGVDCPRVRRRDLDQRPGAEQYRRDGRSPGHQPQQLAAKGGNHQ